MNKSSHEFLALMKKRRSVRKFKNTPVDQTIIENAIKAAATSPSGANRQPWHFIVVTNQIIKNQIREAAEKVEQKFYHADNTKKWVSDLKFLGTNEHKPYLSDAPVIIVTFMRTEVTEIAVEHTTTRAYYAKESVGLASGILLTALHSSGLGTLTHTPQPMSFLNEIFKLDKTYVPYMIIITGYESDDYIAPALPKKELSEICSIYT